MLDCGGGKLAEIMTGLIHSSLLSMILKEPGDTTPGDHLQALAQLFERITAGAPINFRIKPSLLRLDLSNRHLMYASTEMPLYLLSQGESDMVKILEPNSGLLEGDGQESRNREWTWSPGDMLYMTTNGFQAQLNSDREPFGRKRFEALLPSLAQRRMNRQKEIFSNALANHRLLEQLTDDSLVLGVELPS